MDYGEILKKSFKIVKNNKFLWFFGLFVGGSSINFSSIFNYHTNNSELESLKEQVPVDSSSVYASVKGVGKVMGEKIAEIPYSINLLLVILLIIVLLGLAFIYLSMVSRGALIKAAEQLDGEKEYSFKKAWHFGHRYFWRRLSFSLIIALISFVVFSAFLMPIIVSAIYNFNIAVIIFGLVFVLIFFGYMIYISLFLPFAERALFLGNLKIIDSYKKGIELFNHNWLNLILLYLILFGINLIFIISIVFSLGVGGLIVAIVYFLVHYINNLAALVLAGLVFLTLIIVLAIAGGALRSFEWTAITLVYKKITK